MMRGDKKEGIKKGRRSVGDSHTKQSANSMETFDIDFPIMLSCPLESMLPVICIPAYSL